MDDAYEQDDRKKADGVVEHIGYGWCGGKFGTVERHAVLAEQDGGLTEQAPKHQGDPEAWLVDKVLDAGRSGIGQSDSPSSEYESLFGRRTDAIQRLPARERKREISNVSLLHF